MLAKSFDKLIKVLFKVPWFVDVEVWSCPQLLFEYAVRDFFLVGLSRNEHVLQETFFL